MVMEGGPWSVPKYLVEALASETQQSQGRGYPMTIYIYIYRPHLARSSMQGKIPQIGRLIREHPVPLSKALERPEADP